MTHKSLSAGSYCGQSDSDFYNNPCCVVEKCIFLDFKLPHRNALFFIDFGQNFNLSQKNELFDKI